MCQTSPRKLFFVTRPLVTEILFEVPGKHFSSTSNALESKTLCLLCIKSLMLSETSNDCLEWFWINFQQGECVMIARKFLPIFRVNKNIFKEASDCKIYPPLKIAHFEWMQSHRSTWTYFKRILCNVYHLKTKKMYWERIIHMQIMTINNC